VVWLSALAVPFLEARPVLLMAALGWLSALALAKASFHGRRLVRLAFFFLLFWSLLMLLSHLLWPSTLRPVLNLAAWLALGLNLMLAKTPLELALAAGRGLRPLAGRLRAQKLALALALLARLIPAFLDSALKIRITVGRRAAGLPPTRRLSLWAAALVRAALSQTDELSRALIKRWPWD
jgi:hypothetical protein